MEGKGIHREVLFTSVLEGKTGRYLPYLENIPYPASVDWKSVVFREGENCPTKIQQSKEQNQKNLLFQKGRVSGEEEKHDSWEGV